MHQTQSQAITRDPLAGIETHTDGYLEEKLHQAAQKENLEVKRDPADKVCAQRSMVSGKINDK